MKTDTTAPDEYFLVGQDDRHLTIYLRYPLFKALEDFAKREAQTEQVGLLVGREAVDEEGEGYLLVEDAIEAPLGDDTTGRFEESLWRRARRIASARHPNRTVVGWFHTHLDGDVNVSEEERSVHKRYFPEENHLLYVISSKGQDRNFYYRREGELVAAEGFRIYGKTPAGSQEDHVPVGARAGVNTVGPTSEQQTRQIERNFEKLQKSLSSPPVTPKDMAIIALLVVNALLILFRPNPPVTVDTSALERGQSELSAQVGAVRGRIEKLEGQVTDLRLLDDQLKLAAGMEEVDEPEPKATTSAPVQDPDQPNPVAVDTSKLAGGGGAIKLYKVVPNDTLGVLVDKFYPDSPNGTMKSFAEFNRLKAPDYAIFPGDTLKVPALDTLRRG